jgi:hypothetical protein
LVLVLDEIETLQRVRGDVREKGLNALRQLIDDIDSGRFPNLYLLTTGTPAFFDGPQGVVVWNRWPSACTLISDRPASTIPAVQLRRPRPRTADGSRSVRDLFLLIARRRSSSSPA